MSEIGEQLDVEQKEVDTHQTNGFVEVDKMFEGMDYDEERNLQNKIYDNYASTMRRRDREPLEQSSFEGHFFGGGIMKSQWHMVARKTVIF